jgi:hypothetical protein
MNARDVPSGLTFDGLLPTKTSRSASTMEVCTHRLYKCSLFSKKSRECTTHGLWFRAAERTRTVDLLITNQHTFLLISASYMKSVECW